MWPAGLVVIHRVMGWRLQRRNSLNLSSLCVTEMTAVAIHNALTTAAAVLSRDASSGKPPSPGIFAGIEVRPTLRLGPD